MTPYLFVSLPGFLVCFMLAIFVFALNPGNKSNRIFTVFALSIAIWNFGEMMMKIVSTAYSASIWDKIASCFGWLFLGPLFLHFILNFTNKDKILENRFVLFLLYAPSFVWVYLKLFTKFIHSGVMHVYWGWDVIVEPGFTLYTIHLFLLFMIGFFILVNVWEKSEKKILRYQARVVFWGTLIPFGMGTISDAFLPIFGFHFVRMAGMASMVFVAFFAYAIGRYQFMQISPERAASRIVETMPDPLLLADTELKIISGNPSALKLLSYKDAEISGLPLAKIISQESAAFPYKEFNALVEQGERNTYDGDLLTKNQAKIPVILSYSVIRDVTREPIGLVVVAKDVRETKELIEKLSNSQKNIREQSNRLNAILANMTEGLIIENEKHEIIYSNTAAGTLLGKLAEKKCYETPLGGTAELPSCSVDSLLIKGQERFSSIIADRNQRFIEMIGSRLTNPDGTVFALEILRDITDKKKTEDSLKAKLSELEEMNILSVGRELKMMDLEKEVDGLLQELGRPVKYQS